jgi:hypothetical protein
VIMTLPDADSSPQAGAPETGTSAAATPRAGTPQAGAPRAVAPPAPKPTLATAAAGPPGSPQQVTLRDNHTSVTLTWDYPAGSKSQVVISGGRTGQPATEFQRLPAGAADFQVYSLNEQLNYCFTVALRSTTGKLTASAPVCTAR